MGKLQTALLTVIALLLAGQLVATVPGPFRSCEIVGARSGVGLVPVAGDAAAAASALPNGKLECRQSWVP